MYFISMYENGTMKPVEIVLSGVGKRENDGGGKSN
jgi:hypothetical protein